MLTSPPTVNHDKQKRRDDFKPSAACSNSEVILILGEPTPGDLSAILRWGANPSSSRQRRLLIFAADIRGLSQSALQTHYVDIHVLSERLGETSGPNSRCPSQAPGEAMYLVGVLERASRFAAAWRADAEQSTRDGQLTQVHSQLSSRHDGARSSFLSDGTHAIDSPTSTRTTPAASNDVNDIHHSPRDHRYAQSNSNSKPTCASKGLFPNVLNSSSPTPPRPSSPSIHHQNLTNLGNHGQSHNQHFLSDTYPRTLDTILNFLPPDLTEKSLLKQVILLSTLCAQYFAQSKPEIPLLGFSSPTSRASTPSGPSFPQNFKARANSFFSRIPPIESKAGEARRTSTASSSVSGSASPARSSTPSRSATQQKRWSMLSWLSTTTTSQTSDSEPGTTTKAETCTNLNTGASAGKSVELRRRLSSLFGRTPKRPATVLTPSRQGVAKGEESTLKRRRTKMINVQPTSHKHAYLIHVLPTSWVPTSLPESPADTPCHALDGQGTKNLIPEWLETRRNSSPSASPLSGSLDESFTHARMQTSLIRRATLQQMRLERRYSAPAIRVERASSRTIRTPTSRGGLFTRNPVQMQKREKPPLADHLESFLDDYFGQGNGDVLPFILDSGVFGREVGVNMGKKKKRMTMVGEAVLSGLLDEFAMNRQCWVGEEDLRSLVDHLKVCDDEGSVKEEIMKGPKRPPPAAISPSSSEGSEGAGPSGISSSQRSRARAISDIESSVLTSTRNVTSLPGMAMDALKSPEPAHMYPPSRPPTIS